MAGVNLCSRCGAVIESTGSIHVVVSLQGNIITSVYEICNECYDELSIYAKTNTEKINGQDNEDC